jgi:hypothetical protein
MAPAPRWPWFQLDARCSECHGRSSDRQEPPPLSEAKPVICSAGSPVFESPSDEGGEICESDFHESQALTLFEAVAMPNFGRSNFCHAGLQPCNVSTRIQLGSPRTHLSSLMAVSAFFMSPRRASWIMSTKRSLAAGVFEIFWLDHRGNANATLTKHGGDLGKHARHVIHGQPQIITWETVSSTGFDLP